MDDICRLCCSVNFVNNNIFDEENALYLKMSLYLPIKVFKNDRLPQKICDKCSCKVNDFYQFCNEAIEVQSRLRSILYSSGLGIDETIDLSLVKSSGSPPPASTTKLCDQSTQTNTTDVHKENDDVSQPVQVKEEPLNNASSPIKEEEFNDDNLDSDHFDQKSSDSEDISLISLKSRKHKKKADFKEWEALMSSLPEGALAVVDKDSISDLQVQVVKEELDDQAANSNDMKSDVDVYHCCTCMAQCYSRSELLQHYKKHGSQLAASKAPPTPPVPDTDPPRCTRCRQVVKASDWSRHWQRHYERDRRPQRCALCEKTFKDARKILRHGLTHKFGEDAAKGQVDKRYLCDLCPEGFHYMRHLMSHRTRAHPEAAGRALTLRCGQCERSFAHTNSLRRHLRAHTGERNFLCNVCGKALTSSEHLKFHIRIHTGHKPHACKIGDFKILPPDRNATLLRKIRQENSETCGKAFVKKCNLVLHERIHSGDKPNVCSHCGKGFSQRSTLVIHERYHSGARPYVCSLCGRGFVAKGLLSMHLKTTCI